MNIDRDSVDLDHLLENLRDRVEHRRRSGEYPDGLEEELDRHFRRIQEQATPGVSRKELQAAIEMVRATAQFGRHRIAPDSRLPAGDVMHRAVNRALSRQLDGVFHQVQQFSDTVKGALELLAGAVDDPPRHTHTDLLGSIQAIESRLAAIERRLAIDPEPHRALSERLHALEARIGAGEYHPPFNLAEFEHHFRGDEAEIRQRLAEVADELVGHGPVLDIGCGRGELLELLVERAVDVEGVELDAELVRAARARGLIVHHEDGIAHLTDQPPESLGAITAVQLVEHLHPQEVVELVSLAASRLRPGGLLVIETPNVQSLFVHARGFWLDPTHVRFVHPAYLELLARSVGFCDVRVVFSVPAPESDRLLPVPDGHPDDKVVNENVDRLNRLLFEAQDCRVVATR